MIHDTFSHTCKCKYVSHGLVLSREKIMVSDLQAKRTRSNSVYWYSRIHLSEDFILKNGYLGIF